MGHKQVRFERKPNSEAYKHKFCLLVITNGSSKEKTLTPIQLERLSILAQERTRLSVESVSHQEQSRPHLTKLRVSLGRYSVMFLQRNSPAQTQGRIAQEFLPCQNTEEERTIQKHFRTREVAQWAKGLAAKADDLSSIPRTHKEKTSSRNLSPGLHKHAMAHTHTPNTHT